MTGLSNVEEPVSMEACPRELQRHVLIGTSLGVHSRTPSTAGQSRIGLVALASD